MSNRPEPMNAAQQAELGVIVAGMRDMRIPWKVIVRTLNLSRVQLWRCARAAAAASEQMKQQNPGMKHPGDCGKHAAA